MTGFNLYPQQYLLGQFSVAWHLISGRLLTLARMVTEHTQEEQELAPIHVSEPHMLLSGTDAETRRPETEFKQDFHF